MAKYIEVPVKLLRVGDFLRFGGPIKTIDVCDSRPSGCIHINTSNCYDLIGSAEIKVN